MMQLQSFNNAELVRQKKTSRYTEAEKEFIRKNYQAMTDKEIGKHLNRCHRGIEVQRIKMNFIKGHLGIYKSVDGKSYPLCIKAKAYKLYVSGMTIKEISTQLAFSWTTIYRWIKKFEPYQGRNKITIVMQSKINGENLFFDH